MTKIVLVAGASSNLGSVLINDLVERDYIIYAGVRDRKKFKSKGNLHYIKLDITNDADVKRAIRYITSKHKKIDALINCVGVTKVGPTLEFGIEDYQELLETNAIGAFRLIKESIPWMKKGGKIITVSSLNGIVTFPNFGIYSSSKFALDALSEALYYELKKDRIFFTTIAPGAIYNPAITNSNMPHKPAREKFFILKLLLPMITQKEVITEITQTIESQNPPSRIVLGRDAKLVHTMNRILPHSLWNRIMLYVWDHR